MMMLNFLINHNNFGRIAAAAEFCSGFFAVAVQTAKILLHYIFLKVLKKI
jgi:hypothetical protein